MTPTFSMQRESRLLLPQPPVGLSLDAVPGWAAQQRAQSEAAVCVLNLPGPDGARLHWLDTAQASGWVRTTPSPSHRIDSDVLAVTWQAAYRLGFMATDGVLLALLEITGQLPYLSWGQAPMFATPRVPPTQRLNLYAITDHAQRLRDALEAGVRTVQIRIKRPAQPDAAWPNRLHDELVRGIAAARAAGAQCFVNDHWALAGELGADAVHLGQEDLLALGDRGRQQLLAGGMALGISSHSVWELCRARALAPRYIACGPVWPTTTKDMPWVPQGLDNLAWWCQHAGAPVVAIGGILAPAQVQQAAAAGADGVCLVRALGQDPKQVLPAFAAAWAQGRRAPPLAPPRWPHPSLPEG